MKVMERNRMMTGCVRKRMAVCCLMAFMVMTVWAQGPGRAFNPDKFQADLEQFIVQHAGLTSAQSAKFLPLYREMQTKQRQLFNEMRQLRKVDRNNDKACAEAIEQMDNIDLRIKKLQKLYHGKFMAVLPAGKVMDIMRAEDKFHRQAFRKAANRHDKR